jgi:hypothetical protein
MPAGHRLMFVFKWGGPYLMAGLFYAASFMFETASSLRTPISAWPIPDAVYRWLLIMVLLAVVWLIGEFLSVSNRETVISTLQWDAVVSTLTAIAFTGVAGWYFGKGILEWWFVVPWIASICDAVTASWMGINNAAQKPFLSERGTM